LLSAMQWYSGNTVETQHPLVVYACDADTSVAQCLLMPSDAVPCNMMVMLYTGSLSSELYSDRICLATCD